MHSCTLRIREILLPLCTIGSRGKREHQPGTPLSVNSPERPSGHCLLNLVVICAHTHVGMCCRTQLAPRSTRICPNYLLRTFHLPIPPNFYSYPNNTCTIMFLADSPIDFFKETRNRNGFGAQNYQSDLFRHNGLKFRNPASEPFREKQTVPGSSKPRLMPQFLCVQCPVMINHSTPLCCCSRAPEKVLPIHFTGLMSLRGKSNFINTGI